MQEEQVICAVSGVKVWKSEAKQGFTIRPSLQNLKIEFELSILREKIDFVINEQNTHLFELLQEIADDGKDAEH
jgi:hypothetical protein